MGQTSQRYSESAAKATEAVIVNQIRALWTCFGFSMSFRRTNRLLSVVRPRMTDKTSWTKPPSLHHYGDSRGGDRRAEAAFDPRGGHHRKGAARDRATAAAPPRQASEMRGRRRYGGRRGAQRPG